MTRFAAAVFGAAAAFSASAAPAPGRLQVSRAQGAIAIDGVSRRPRLARGRGDPRVLRDLARRQHAPEGEDDGLARIRRPLLLRRHPVRRPEPAETSVPTYVERDHVSNDQDFAGIMLDTRNDGRTGSSSSSTRTASRTTSSSTSPREREQRRPLPGLPLGLGRQDHPGRLAARDANPVLEPALRERRPADVGDRHLPQPPARLPVPDRE